jgi:hypothetical protein
MPTPLPGERSPASAVSTSRSKRRGLLAEPSDSTVAAADEVVRLEAEVRALGLKREREIALDWFREREAAEAAQAAEDAELEEARIAEERERRRRQEIQDRWVRYALGQVPDEARGYVESQLHAKVKALLAKVDVEEADGVVGQLVDATVAGVLRPWWRRQEVEQVIAEAMNELPYLARGLSSSPTQWEQRAERAAKEEVGRLGTEASMQEVETVAAQAVQSVAAQYAAHRKAKEDAAARDRLIMWLPLQLMRDFTPEVRELAVKTVKAAFAELPVGTPREKLEKACDAALEPFYAALAERRRLLQEKADQEQKKWLAALQSQLQPPPQLQPPQLQPPPKQLHRAPVVNRRPPASK